MIFTTRDDKSCINVAQIVTWISDVSLTSTVYKGGDIVSMCFLYMFY